MKNLFIIILLTLPGSMSFAQRANVLAAFKKYDLPTDILEPKSKQRPVNYAYDLKYISIAGDKETVTLAKFDPSKSEEERWTVVSVKGKAPSASQIKSFRNARGKPETTAGRTDESTYKVEKETPDLLLISYKQDPASIPAEASFMKDCRMYLSINPKTKRLESLQCLNEKPLKIKIVKAEKLDLLVKYKYDENGKRYLAQSEDLNLMIRLLGQLSPMETISEYSNYRKVM